MFKFAAAALVAWPATAYAAPITARVGDEIFHEEQSGNLIGAGRQTTSVSVRYLGLKGPRQPRFERTEITAEDMSGIHTSAPPVMLPPLITPILIDMAKEPEMDVDGRNIHILAATASSVTYEVAESR